MYLIASWIYNKHKTKRTNGSEKMFPIKFFLKQKQFIIIYMIRNYPRGTVSFKSHCKASCFPCSSKALPIISRQAV